MQAHIRRDRCAYRAAVARMEHMHQQEAVEVDADVEMMDVESTGEAAMEVSSSSDNESAGKVVNN